MAYTDAYYDTAGLGGTRIPPKDPAGSPQLGAPPVDAATLAYRNTPEYKYAQTRGQAYMASPGYAADMAGNAQAVQRQTAAYNADQASKEKAFYANQTAQNATGQYTGPLKTFEGAQFNPGQQASWDAMSTQQRDQNAPGWNLSPQDYAQTDRGQTYQYAQSHNGQGPPPGVSAWTANNSYGQYDTPQSYNQGPAQREPGPPQTRALPKIGGSTLYQPPAPGNGQPMDNTGGPMLGGGR